MKPFAVLLPLFLLACGPQPSAETEVQEPVSQAVEAPVEQPAQEFAPNGITPLAFIETMGRDPGYLGEECHEYETGTECVWGETEYFGSASVVHRNFEDYTVLIFEPKFPERAVPEGILDSSTDASGALQGGRANYTTNNVGEIQLQVQSKAAAERLSQ